MQTICNRDEDGIVVGIDFPMKMKTSDSLCRRELLLANISKTSFFHFSAVQKMTNQRQVVGWSLFTLLMSHCLLMTFAYPQQFSQQQIASYQQPQQNRFIPAAQVPDEGRKYAEKPNALKKVALDDIDDDIQTNQISDNGFSWSNMLGGVNEA